MIKQIAILNLKAFHAFWGVPYNKDCEKVIVAATEMLLNVTKLNASVLKMSLFVPVKNKEERRKQNEKKGIDAFDLLANVGGFK